MKKQFIIVPEWKVADKEADSEKTRLYESKEAALKHKTSGDIIVEVTL